MRQLFIPILFLLYSCTTTKKNASGLCGDYFKSIKIHCIKGERQCSVIYIANNVVVREDEIVPGPIRSVHFVTCDSSIKAYGDIGVNGVLVVNTKQAFDYLMLSSVDSQYASQYKEKKKLYFLNGFLITNDSLKISKKAIKSIEILSAKKYNATVDIRNTVLINIWIQTKEEITALLAKCSRSYD